jgi:cytochrome c biogenesis protein CcmG, thiol:disulfide interchange protein DsbE
MSKWIAFCALVALATPALATPKAGDPAPDFEQTTLAGGKLRLSSLHGKVVLVDFWASWCEPCKKELPLLSQLAKRLRPKGVEIVAINVDTKRDSVDQFLKQHGIDLPVLLDPKGAIAQFYEPPKMPSSFVVDKTGRIRAVNAGFEPGDEKKIEQELLDLAGK